MSKERWSIGIVGGTGMLGKRCRYHQGDTVAHFPAMIAMVRDRDGNPCSRIEANIGEARNLTESEPKAVVFAGAAECPKRGIPDIRCERECSWMVSPKQSFKPSFQTGTLCPMAELLDVVRTRGPA